MYIIGAGGHGKVIAEIILLNSLKIRSFIDEDRTKEEVLKFKVEHTFPCEYVNAIIAIGDNLKRKIFSQRLNYNFCTLIHPKSVISMFCKLGYGTVVMGGVTVNVDARIGNHVVLNTNSSVGHDCIIGDYVHVAPNAALAGNVRVGEGTLIGMGSCIKQGVKIGKWCIVGAGTVIVNDIPDRAIIYGNPGKVLRVKEQESVLSKVD